MITDELREVVKRAIWTEGKARTADRLAYEERGPGADEVLTKIANDALTAALPMIRIGMDDRHGFGELVSSAYAEADKAMRKFPQPNYVISKVAEEAGEVVKAAIHCAEKRETAENVAGEMKQLIAMLYRLWVEGDQVHGLSPIAEAIRAMKGRDTLPAPWQPDQWLGFGKVD